MQLQQIRNSSVWQGELKRGNLPDGVYALSAKVQDMDGNTAEDSIRMVLGASAYQAQERQERDQDNAVGAWPERGLMGTLLGPNKNGRKW